MNLNQVYQENLARRVRSLYQKDDFSRKDEAIDSKFYEKPRFVEHLDSTALAAVTKVIDKLVVEKNPVVLDLMASWDSHLPFSLDPAEVVGLGMNAEELKTNQALDRYVVQDLNEKNILPFNDACFNLVLNTVSVDYLTNPEAVFAEVARVLKPGGLFLVFFSNRFFEPKVTRIWRNASESERICLVEQWLADSGLFTDTKVFVQKGLKRPEDDKYAHTGLPSDPVIAVWAERKGGLANKPPRPRPAPRPRSLTPAELRAQAKEVARNLKCPYCGERLVKWQVPQTPFTEWDAPFMHLCANDQCSYLQAGFEVMSEQGNTGVSYRFVFNPQNNSVISLPVHSLSTLKDGIVE